MPASRKGSATLRYLHLKLHFEQCKSVFKKLSSGGADPTG